MRSTWDDHLKAGAFAKWLESQRAVAKRLGVSRNTVQRFVPEVQSVRETSLMFIVGRYSHALVKREKQGDIRTQGDFGATREIAVASAIADALAQGTSE
jgi:DNA-binding transcriptional regulator YhcF (GntR family)